MIEENKLEFIILDYDPFDDEDENQVNNDGLLVYSKDEYANPYGL
jgi:hypothetical protein